MEFLILCDFDRKLYSLAAEDFSSLFSCAWGSIMVEVTVDLLFREVFIEINRKVENYNK